MKILFVIPNLSGDFHKPTYPHIGVAYIVSMLEKNGHKTAIIDMRIQKKLKFLDKQVCSFDPDLIGVSFMSRDYRKAYDFVTSIKKRYNKKVVIGGPHPSLYQEEALEACNADYAIIGEGEYAILDLANGKRLSEIKNIIWRDGEKIIKNKLEYIKDLDKLPFPDYTKFQLDKYVDKKIPIITSRGCPYRCIYCSIKNVMGRKWRARSAENVIDEMKLWKKRGYSFFQISDDNFSLDRKRVEKFCSLIIKNKLTIGWELRNGIRADTVDEQLLQLMKKAGCKYIAYGIESLDQEVLDASKKGLNIKLAVKAVEATLRVGIKTGVSFIIGLPKDNLTKFQKVLTFLKTYDFDEVMVYNCVPYPKTELFDWVKKNALICINSDDYLNFASYWKNDVLFETPEFSREQRKQAFKSAEKIVWKKLFKKEFGSFFGTAGYWIWLNPSLRSMVIRPAEYFWAKYRRWRWSKMEDTSSALY